MHPGWPSTDVPLDHPIGVMTEQCPAGPISRDLAHVDQVPPARETSTAPARAGVVLISLILVAAVANLNLAVANVALPDIGKAFDAGQTALNLVAVGYSLGLAASVLYLGALGDRYGRKRMLLLGTGLRFRRVCWPPWLRRSRCCSPRACSADWRRAWRIRRRWL